MTTLRVEKSMKNNWTHYKRGNDDGSTCYWWSRDVDFVFSAETTTACGGVNSDVQWDVIPGGAFEKPAGTQAGVGSAVLLLDSYVDNLTANSNYDNNG